MSDYFVIQNIFLSLKGKKKITLHLICKHNKLKIKKIAHAVRITCVI